MLAAVPVSAERRSRARLAVERMAVLRFEGGAEDIVLEDLTRGGCRFRCARELPLLAAVSVGIAGVGHTPARLVWTSGQSYGCAFDRPLPEGAVAAAAPDNIARIMQATSFWQSEGEGGDLFGFEEEELVERLPIRARVAVVAGLTATLWAAIVGLVRSITANLG